MASGIVPVNSRRWVRILVMSTAATVLTQTVTPAAGAGEPDADRIASVVGALINARDAMLVDPATAPRAPAPGGNTVIAGIGITEELATAEDRQRAGLRDLRAAVAAAGTGFDAADTRVTTRSVSRHGDRIVAVVNTRSRFRLAQRDHPTPTEDDFHVSSVDRRVEFTRDTEGWRITGIRLTSQTGSTPTNEAPARRAGDPDGRRSAPLGGGRRQAASTPRTGAGVTKADHQAIRAYAVRYWEDYNPEYRDYDELGGDCTNFVSQAMRAGGWTDVAGPWADHKAWWHQPRNESHSWISVEKWFGFSRSSGRTRLGEVAELGVGDVLQVDFQNNGKRDHTMIVTKTRGTEKYLTYHSDDEYNKPLTMIEEQNPEAVYTAHLT